MEERNFCDARNSNALTGKVRIKLTSVEDQAPHIPQEEKDKYKETDPTLFVIALPFLFVFEVVQTPQLLVVEVFFETDDFSTILLYLNVQ